MTVEAHVNPRFNTNPGNATQDKIFLLSIDEVNKYLENLEDILNFANIFQEGKGNASISGKTVTINLQYGIDSAKIL